MTIISVYILLVIVSSLLMLPIYKVLQKELALLKEYDLYRFVTLIVAVGFIAFPFYFIAAIFTYAICIFQYFLEGVSFKETIKEIYESKD